MAQRDELEPRVLLQRFVEVEHEVAGNAEDLPHAAGVQLVEQDLMQFHASW
jgi:hypothetical protein